ncbi:MAG TPA: M55 family metallopeptidase [Candidatus Ruthenibacterium avium]|uniref:M55 family metallopeptidase n=1 Tax=Candidatus Ruthenibacterium avium TaxID=2838751 RepID=A0A9D2M171_9FIRM|nr:M55 family metallopeptidase [Candidatus Ruthenibacterium avium]
MNVFFSCDMEGCCGVTSWLDTGDEGEDYGAFCAAQHRMTCETAAACAAAVDAEAERILVKDAHGLGRNIDLAALPEQVQVNRGWSGDIYGMMSGIHRGQWDAVCLIGYHSGAGFGGSPLGHTLSREVDSIEMNGALIDELTLSVYTAACFGVPVCFVSGDAGVCEQAQSLIPGVATVPTGKGDGGSVTCLHPALAETRIHDTLLTQLNSGNYEQCRVELPASFDVYVRYKNEPDAYAASFYPGAELSDERTLHFSSIDFCEILRLFHFIL